MKKISKAKVPPEEKEQFLTEINILKELDHPNILRIYDFFADDDFYYMVSQYSLPSLEFLLTISRYCAGGDMFSRMKKKPCQNEKQSAELIRQILSALSYCHSKGVIHTYLND